MSKSGACARHLAVLAVVLLSAASALAQEAEIAVADQRVESGNIVRVDKANIPAVGFVVIHEAKDQDAPGAPIGHALLSAGSNSNVSVKLEQSVEPGAKLIAVLHEDTSKTGMFDPDTAKPVAKPDGATVKAEFVAK